MEFVWFILIGFSAGWLAGQITDSPKSGVVGNLVVGVIGAILGGWGFGLLGLEATSMMGTMITATVGAVLLIQGLRWYSTKVK